MKILVGTPIHRGGAYALEKFLANQQQIQQNYLDCDLVLSTADSSYVTELLNMIDCWNLRGTALNHKVEKPDYAKSRLWDIACGRESIRRYFLSQPDAEKLLFLDADMTYDPEIIGILTAKMAGNDAVFSGYRFRNNRIGLIGAGCLLLERKALKKIKFRCYEFKNGQVIQEDNVIEMDLFRQRCRIKKGFFLSIDHYASPTEAMHIDLQKVALWRKVLTSAVVRFCLIRSSVAVHYNIPSKGQKILWWFLRIFDQFRRA